MLHPMKLLVLALILWIVSASFTAQSEKIKSDIRYHLDRQEGGEFIPAQHLHCALTSDPSTLVITWHSPLLVTEPFCVYGNQSTWEALVTDPQTVYINTSNIRYSSYEASAGYDYYTEATGIQTPTIYYGCGSKGGLSVVGFAQLAPIDESFSVAIIGDLGVQNCQNTIKRLNTIDSQVPGTFFFIHLGDISYADAYDPSDYESVWNQWFTSMNYVLPKFPYMVLPGNHEFGCGHPRCDIFDAPFKAYNSKFHGATTELEQQNMYYSTDVGNTHFVFIDTETDYPNCPYPEVTFGDQLSWLEADLAAARQNEAIDWIIVSGHRPIYSSASGYEYDGIPSNITQPMQAAFENLFYQYHVDIYFAGHVHSYERIYPVYQSQVYLSYDSPPYTAYVVSGGAGNLEGLKINYTDPPPNWSALVYDTDYGYGTLTIDSSSLLWQYFSSSDGILRDQFLLTK